MNYLNSRENKPYIIAECNSSHNGNIDTAKQMIKTAKECGCDCVKFQSWSSESLYSDQYYIENPITERIVRKLSLSKEQILELADYSKMIDIDFSSTPYSEEEVDFLVDVVNAPFIKVASMEINNYPYLSFIAKKGRPIILSTGMASIEEVHRAVKTIVNEGNDSICILHCVSIYPAPAEIINLRNIEMLKKEFPRFIIGYSDHSIGYEIAVASVAMGANVIEKHFTLDNSKLGMDNNMATEPEQMKELVIACRNVYNALGAYERTVSVQEKEMANKMRRSVISAKDIEAGHKIIEGDLTSKRPGDGLSPEWIYKLQGKIIKNDIPKGYQIKKDDIKQEVENDK